jgi:hypothetical protein
LTILEQRSFFKKYSLLLWNDARFDDSMPDDSTPDEQSWVALFFNEENIVHTFQLLLTSGDQTMDELFKLCLVVHESPLVLAFTVEGLTPFAMHSEYVIPYKLMNKRQLQVLRRECRACTNDVMAVDYGIDVYVVKIDNSACEIDPALMLFATVCIIYKGLCTQRLTKHGYIWKNLEPSEITYHLNNAIFKIVHSCLLRPGVQKQAMQLVHKHGVIQYPGEQLAAVKCP